MNMTSTLSIRELVELTDVEAVLTSLGVTYEKASANEVRFICPWHTEQFPSLYFNLIKRIFHCLGCCKKGNLFSFIKDYKNLNNRQVIEFLLQFNGMSESDIESYNPLSELDRESREYQKTLLRINQDATHPILEANMQALLQRSRTTDIPYLLNRGFIPETLDYFNLGFCTNEPFENLITIPIHDDAGNLVGYSMRKSVDEKNTKYKHMHKLNKKHLLYNMHRAKEFTAPNRPLMLVEGFADVWMAYQYGYKCAVAVMGDHLNDGQEDLVLKYAYSFIIAFDHDSAGIKGAKEAAKKLRKFGRTFVFVAPKGKDIADLTKEEFIDCMKNMKEVTYNGAQ